MEFLGHIEVDGPGDGTRKQLTAAELARSSELVSAGPSGALGFPAGDRTRFMGSAGRDQAA